MSGIEHDLYPYYKAPDDPTWDGEVPTPEAVGYTGDPGIIVTKANADHVHSVNTDSGTLVQEKMIRYMGNWWGPGVVGGSFQRISTLGACQLKKRFAGTSLRYTYSCSGWNSGAAGGIIGIIGSPTDSTGDGTLISQFYFNQLGIHAAWTGVLDIPSRGIGTYNNALYVWSAGPALTFSNDYSDYIWFKVAEVWP